MNVLIKICEVTVPLVFGLASAVAFALGYVVLGIFLAAIAALSAAFALGCWVASTYNLSGGEKEKVTPTVELPLSRFVSESSGGSEINGPSQLRDKPAIESGSPSVSFEVARPAEQSPVGPSQIMKEVDNARPVVRDRIRESFVGASVCWTKLRLSGVKRLKPYSGEKENLLVHLHDENHTMVACELPPEEEAKLAFLDSNHLVTVRGRIAKVEQLWIQLDEAIIQP